MGLCWSKGCTVVAFQTLMITPLSRTRTQVTHMWCMAGQAAEYLSDLQHWQLAALQLFDRQRPQNTSFKRYQPCLLFYQKIRSIFEIDFAPSKWPYSLVVIIKCMIFIFGNCIFPLNFSKFGTCQLKIVTVPPSRKWAEEFLPFFSCLMTLQKCWRILLIRNA